MKTKTLIKILTLSLFILLIFGFTLYKGGYLFSDEKNVAYISDPNGGIGAEIRSLGQEMFGLNTFQKLKMAHVFDPESFDTGYYAPVTYSDNHFLSSSKSVLISDRIPLKHPFALYDSFLSALLNQQFDTIKSLKK